MKLVNHIKRFVSHLFRMLELLRKGWHEGGVTEVKVVQVNQGGILSGKKILITGGGSGIGLAIAKKCVREGAQVVITGRNLEKLESAKKEIGDHSVSILQWDVSDTLTIEKKLVEVNELAGGLVDVLINNAGILLDQSYFTTTEDVWDKTYAVNSKAVFFLSQKISKLWIKERVCGKIVNISSAGGLLGATYPYRMTKWDVVGLTEGLGRKLSPHGIIVNAIAPGRIATGMLDRNAEGNVYDTAQPLKRLGLPAEVAELAVFLVSDASNYIVGQTIVCDGGYTLRG